MAVKPSSTALDTSSEGSPVMPSVRVLYQPKPLQQNRATAEMESAHQLVEELAGPLFQMQAVADGEAHQDGQHHGRHAGCLDDGIDADGDGTEPEQGGQVIFQPLRQIFPSAVPSRPPSSTAVQFVKTPIGILSNRKIPNAIESAFIYRHRRCPPAYGKNHRSVGIVFFMRCAQSSSLP